MIDHVLGRPSSRFRKIQVLLVLSFWTTYLLRGHTHGPPLLRRLSKHLTTRLTTWQTITLTMLYLYFARNFAKIMGLECPEPMANLYSRSYFRATWIMTALDAGFWTAMTIKRKWVRDLASVVFSGYYLFAAERADEKVRRVRAVVTVEHLRVGWEKNTTPYLRLLTQIMHPLRNRYKPRHVRIPRPAQSVYSDPVEVWIYFEGTREELARQTNIVLDFPGGGFVAMGPRNHEDKLIGWSRKLKVPIVSVEYRKAPEWPYPYAINECYDVYHEIMTTKGKCIGLSGEVRPRIVVTGDSAGGNYAAGVTLMILNSSSGYEGRDEELALPHPAGVLLVYPCLDMNIASWMDDDQVRLIRERGARATNRGVVRRKSDYFAQASGKMKIDEEPEEASGTGLQTRPQTTLENGIDITKVPATSTAITTSTSPSTKQSTLPPSSSSTIPTTKLLSTRLAMTSRLTYFNDRVLTPEMMRAMVILYIGPHNRPDFTKDYLLSPIVAPDHLLAKFPRTMFLTGERDPLVDDTVIFAGRIGRAKRVAATSTTNPRASAAAANPKEFPLVRLIPGISHGFLLMAGMFPEAKREIVRCARWIGEVFDDVAAEEEEERRRKEGGGGGGGLLGVAHDGEQVDGGESRRRHHHRTDTGATSVGMASSDEEDDGGEKKSKGKKGASGTAAATSLSTSPSSVRGVGSARGGRGGLSKGRLGSEEDLVGRRMQGLMGGLTGLEDLEGVLHP
ncbi:Alpha/Beta hydrolase protein [Peziza echinospora]|nr:Alpha/Beta hydrolase protein [Peziza echinospora]